MNLRHHFKAMALNAHLFCAFAILFVSFGTVFSQQSAARPDRGLASTGSFAISDVENVNLQNGNLNLSIPLASLPPMAGGKLGWTVRAEYNGKVWDAVRSEHLADPLDQGSKYVRSDLQIAGGWNVGGQYQITFQTISWDYQFLLATNDPEYNEISQHRWTKVVLTTPDGATHELRPMDYSSYPDGYLQHNYLRGYYKYDPVSVAGPMRYYSFDGSHIWARIENDSSILSGNSSAWTVYLPDGTKVVQSAGIQRITDTNGNKVKIFVTGGNGSPFTTHYQDELTGREINYTYDPTGNGGYGLGQVQYQTVGGTWMTITVNFGITHVTGKAYADGFPDCPGANQQAYGDLSVVRSIVFPQTEPGLTGRQFTFAYNSDTTDTVYQPYYPGCAGSTNITSMSHGLGSLSQMTMPSGAVINYGYNFDGEVLLDDPNNLPREGVSAKQVVHDGTSETWTYGTSQFGTATVNGPDGTTVTETRYPSDPAFAHYNASFGGKEGLTYRINQSSKILTERHWTLMNFGGDNVAPGPATLVAFNPVVDAEYTSLLDDSPSHNVIKMSAKTYQYDYNGNLLDERDYDWFDPNSCTVSRDNEGVPTGVPACAVLLRETSSTFYSQATMAGSGNVYARQALNATSPLIQNALSETITGNADVRLSYDSNSWGTAPSVGNLTTQAVKLDANIWISTSMTYETYGNLASTTDGRGHTTYLYYDDSPFAAPNRVVVNPDNTTGAQTTTTVYDYYTGLATSTTDPNNQTSTIDYNNVLLGSMDPFGRPGITKSPVVTVNSTQQQHRVTTTYIDHSRQVIVASDLFAESDQLLKRKTTSDMLGRPVLTQQTEDGTNYTISAYKAYDTIHRVTFSSAPMRSSASSTDSWTRVTNDLLGRPTEVATFGGASQPPYSGTTGVSGFTGTVSTSYDANFTTVTDQAGKVRRSMTDGAGRLVRVDEPDGSGNLGTVSSPNQSTNYTYDVLGNLVKVEQGSQMRYFMYDPLSRLIRARNPEQATNPNLALSDAVTGNSQWCMAYSYDENGNLTGKTDARGVGTTYSYDSLNRVTYKSYSNDPNATPAVTYTYDTLGTSLNGKGRLTSVSSSVAMYSYGGYDATGKVLSATQTVYGSTNRSYLITDIKYGLAGHLMSMKYPSGDTITNAYDNAGRLQSFTGNLGDGFFRTYSSGISYTSIGGMQQEQFGTATTIYNKLNYNSRGQLAEIRAATSGNDTTFNRGKIVNDYSLQCSGASCNATDNNGNLRKQTVYVPDSDTNTNPTSRYQQYDYDSLNRVTQVHEYTGNTLLDWQQVFTYDRFGNRTIDYNTTTNNSYNSIPRPQFTVDTSTNRLYAPNDPNHYLMDYDAAGNQKNDSYTSYGSTNGAATRTYDAENRMTSETTYNSVVSGSYSYDGDGHRVKRVAGSTQTWQVYGIGGELIAEYAASGDPSRPQKEYGYRNGQLLITAESGVALGVAPTGLAETSASSSSITVSWGATIGATNYRIERKQANAGFTYAGHTNSSSTSWSDSVSAGSAYLYRVCTANSSDLCTSSYSNIALGVAVSFTDDPIVGVSETSNPANATNIKAAHINELRAAVQAVRDLAIVGSASYTHANPTAGVSLVYVEDVRELRTKLNEALTVLHLETPPFTDPTLVGVHEDAAHATPVKAIHIRELRQRLQGTIGSSCYKSVDQFVKDFYQGVLKRQPNASELASATASLESAQSSGASALITAAQNLGSSLFNSTEYANLGTSNDQFVTDLYNGYLQRAEDTSGHGFWMSELAAHNRAYLIANFGGSIEFTENAKALCRTAGGGSTVGSVHWMIADQLGTPRMIVDASGSLASVSRHDYLPFGEELGQGTGNRGPSYTNADGARQKFTSKEHDNETGLDYFLARYYSSAQGRFTGVDTAGPDLTNPQTLNKYAYCLNSPLRMVDKNGRYGQDVHEDLTRVLAYAAGFSLRDSAQLARQTQAPDEDWRSAYNGIYQRAMYHFTDSERRQEMWCGFGEAATTGSRDDIMKSLGEFMHAHEDSYSHEGYGAGTGQGYDYLRGKDPYAADYTDTDPAKANRMAATSFEKLKQAGAVLQKNSQFDPQAKAISYGAIRGLVNQFNRESDPEKKRQIIRQIEAKITAARHLQESPTGTTTMPMIRIPRKRELE